MAFGLAMSLLEEIQARTRHEAFVSFFKPASNLGCHRRGAECQVLVQLILVQHCHRHGDAGLSLDDRLMEMTLHQYRAPINGVAEDSEPETRHSLTAQHLSRAVQFVSQGLPHLFLTI